MNAVAPVRVLIADDHPMIRWGLAQLVSAEPDLELVGTAEDGARAVELAELEHPDVVLLDLSMPELDGVSAAEQMRERSPSSRVLVLSSHPQESVVTAAFLAGARGYLTKDVSTTDVIEGIRNVHAGRTIGTERLSTDSREGLSNTSARVSETAPAMIISLGSHLAAGPRSCPSAAPGPGL